jgi:hypothetical protein
MISMVEAATTELSTPSIIFARFAIYNVEERKRTTKTTSVQGQRKYTNNNNNKTLISLSLLTGVSAEIIILVIGTITTGLTSFPMLIPAARSAQSEPANR